MTMPAKDGSASLVTGRKGPKRTAERVEPSPVVTSFDLPLHSLEDALRVPKVLRDAFAGRAATFPQIEAVLGVADKDETKALFRSAQAYNLLDRDVDHYSMSETARRILAASTAEERLDAIRQAVLMPVLFSQFFTEYSGNPLPGDDLLGPILQRRFGVPEPRVVEAKRVLQANAVIAGILERTGDGGFRVMLPNVTPAPSDLPAGVDGPPAVDYARMCFVITPIGDDDSQERKHANLVLKAIIEPVVAELDLFALRGDQIDRAGIISRQTFECLAQARVAIADLSFGNPNAFYELGVRHVFKLPTVQLIRKDHKIPFDVSQGRTIKIDLTDVYNVYESIESARKELRQQLKQAISPAYDGKDNPLTTYLPNAQIRITI